MFKEQKDTVLTENEIWTKKLLSVFAEAAEAIEPTHNPEVAGNVVQLPLLKIEDEYPASAHPPGSVYKIIKHCYDIDPESNSKFVGMRNRTVAGDKNIYVSLHLEISNGVAQLNGRYVGATHQENRMSNIFTIKDNPMVVQFIFKEWLGWYLNNYTKIKQLETSLSFYDKDRS